jgi:hypothetical protein
MQWIEALINVLAFAAFIGVANHWPNAQPNGGNQAGLSNAARHR